jgi:predicted nucleic acid-binding protein
MSPIVVDASVMIAWASGEPEASGWVALFREGAETDAPDLLLLELAHGLLRKVGNGLAASDLPVRVVARVQAGLIRFHDWHGLLPDAMALALALHHPVIDCTYLALARRRRARLATLDRRLAARAASAPGGPIPLWTPT